MSLHDSQTSSMFRSIGTNKKTKYIKNNYPHTTTSPNQQTNLYRAANTPSTQLNKQNNSAAHSSSQITSQYVMLTVKL